jgi:hypothetical protein
MGRFATTVPLYEKLRPPYPAVFSRNVARRLRLGKEHALIDLGTGPGLLALGFAPYVGRIVGVEGTMGRVLIFLIRFWKEFIPNVAGRRRQANATRLAPSCLIDFLFVADCQAT